MQTSQSKTPSKANASLESESWESLAQMALQFEITALNNNGGRQLAKRLQYLKQMIHFYLKDQEGIELFSSSKVLVKFSRMVHRVETYLVKHEIPSTPFVIFLKAIVEKAKKEKIKAEKPYERRLEFGRLKDQSAPDTPNTGIL